MSSWETPLKRAGPGGWGGGGGASGPQTPEEIAAQEARMEAFRKAKLATTTTMQYFAAGVCGIIALITLLHWTRRAYVKLQRTRNASEAPFWALPFVVVSRKIHPLLLHRLPPFQTISNFFLCTTYLALNITLLLTQIALSSYSVLGKRSGFLASSNLCVVVFLSLKHTPLSLLTRTSYERLNPLHQLAGFLTIAMTALHGIVYTINFMTNDRAFLLRRPSDVAGIIAGVAMFMMGLVPLLLKTRAYEWFYAAHIITFIVLIITTALHQPHTAEKVAIMTIVAGTIWLADRLARLVRMALNFFPANTATLHPLPDGGVRVILARSPLRTSPGKHVFLYIPSISLFQSHPFSVVSLSPDKSNAEFVIKSRNGFTRRLHTLASSTPGISVRASADGAYGAFPSPTTSNFDKIVLIAGGSGASFTFGLAHNLLDHLQDIARKSQNKEEGNVKKMAVNFIWAVRTHENLTWFTNELRNLRQHPQAHNITVSLHVTRIPGDTGAADGASSHSLSDAERELGSTNVDAEEKRDPVIKTAAAAPEGGAAMTTVVLDEEKGVSMDGRPSSAGGASSHHEGHPLRPGRPDLSALIDAAVAETPKGQRVLIAGCGPKELAKVVRTGAARNMRSEGPAVEFHCETFGW